jgi:hypothetical protein
MLHKARKGVFILDVPDAAKQAECEAYRTSTLAPGEYKRKYSGLQHLYYDKSWFNKLAAENGWHVTIEDQCIGGYVNNQFRFNCYMTPA